MVTLRRLPQSSFRRSRWKNGGGETIEIAASPEGAGLDDFTWRISMARVARSGPFSIFPGVERTLSVLEGGAITLQFEQRGSVRLDGESPPYSFPADITVSGEVEGEGITDLNVMTRRGAARHHVSKLRVSPGEQSLEPLGTCLVVLTLGPALALRLGDAAIRLNSGDAALIEPMDGQAPILIAAAPGEVFIVDLWS